MPIKSVELLPTTAKALVGEPKSCKQRVILVATMLVICAATYTALFGLTTPANKLHNIGMLVVNNDVGMDCTAPTVCTGVTSLDGAAQMMFNNMGAKLVNAVKTEQYFSSTDNKYKDVIDVLDWSFATDVSLEEAEKMVNDEKYWIIMHIPSDYSQNHVKAFNTIDKTKYSNPVDVVYDCGANRHTCSLYVRFLKAVEKTLMDRGMDALEASAAFGSIASYVKPSFYAHWYEMKEIDLHPAEYAASYLCFALAVVSSIMGVFNSHVTVNVCSEESPSSSSSSNTSNDHPVFKFGWKTVLTIFSFCTLESIVIGIIARIVTSDVTLGLTAWIWLFTLTFSSISLTFIMCVGPKLAVIPNALFILINYQTSGALFATEMLYGFFGAIGPCLPMWHFVHGSRAIVFGSFGGDWHSSAIVALVYLCLCGLSSTILGVADFQSHWKKWCKTRVGKFMGNLMPGGQSSIMIPI
eukprot:TRINITY_DN10471_c0_g1_i1.p1 TRINITY_DN10471_c0_g1~~TRINITY_DN10471_c0_g1_i1.p1  ORF type:complete len:467 (-),score=128.13 TRINITY_DN10471_c0_g1_i1:524-1924(-)